MPEPAWPVAVINQILNNVPELKKCVVGLDWSALTSIPESDVAFREWAWQGCSVVRRAYDIVLEAPCRCLAMVAIRVLTADRTPIDQAAERAELAQKMGLVPLCAAGMRLLGEAADRQAKDTDTLDRLHIEQADHLECCGSCRRASEFRLWCQFLDLLARNWTLKFPALSQTLDPIVRELKTWSFEKSLDPRWSWWRQLLQDLRSLDLEFPPFFA